jgi:hypothetical protein
MSEIKVNKISPKQTCTQLTLGDSGDTIIIPAGATITNNGTATGFGRTGTVDWDTTPKTTTVTAVSGVGYFVNTTAGAITVNLPAGVAGSIVAVSDYANTSATNKIVVAPNGSQKIQGINSNYEIKVNGGTVTLVYVDSTQGWRPTDAATASSITEGALFVAATGGTILTCGDFKTHVFTGPGTFTVSSAGNSVGSNSVEYLVVAGGGGGGNRHGAGGGAGGYRQNYPSPTTAGLPVTAQGYPITVGAGGAPGSTCSPVRANPGNPSIFSTITSTGGGGADGSTGPGGPGGSGSGVRGGSAGTGNTPPVSPPQGNNGGASPANSDYNGSGGGGAGAAGCNSKPGGGNGGIGSPIATTLFGPTSPSYGTPGPAPGRYFSGGGGGGSFQGVGSPGPIGVGGSGGGGSGGAFPIAPTGGTINTGGGGGGGGGSPTAPEPSCAGGTGGSGIVAIRYKFQ